MKRTAISLLALSLAASSTASADGMLDPSFGNGGIVLSDFGGGPQPVSHARSLVVLPDGRAVAAGNATVNLGGTYMGAARYLPSGWLDPSFGGPGWVIHAGGPGLANASAEDVLLQPDGRIVLVGRYQVTQVQFALVRLTAAGAPDPSFGTAGWVNTTVSGGGAAVAAVLQPDGRIVAVGSPGVAVRYMDNGILDAAFGLNGIAVLPLSGTAPRDVALQPDGKLVIGGEYAGDFILVRLLPSGAPDPSFDGDGVVTTNFGGNESGYSVILLPDGRIVLAGSYNGDFALARYLPDGTLDTTFGTGGLATASSGVGVLPDDAILLPNGKLFVVGSTTDSNRDFHLVRFHPDGALDTSFGSAGFLRTDLGGAFDDCRGVAIAGPDRVLTAGTMQSGFPGPSRFALARYIATTPVELLRFQVE